MQLSIAIEPSPLYSNVHIQDEVSRLWALMVRVPAFSESGHDNQEAIEAQLSALAEGLTVDQAWAEFSDGCTEAYVLDAALAAAEWLWHGGEAPSAQWRRIAGNRAACFIN